MPSSPNHDHHHRHPQSQEIMTMEDLHKRRPHDLFSVASWSYAPSNLRHLRPPVPNDLPSHQDPSVFSFEDALEDLLAVSQGRPLPDIDTRYGQRQLLRQMYPDGEPAWFWFRRLQSQGLVGRLRDPNDDLGFFGRHIESELARLHWPTSWEAGLLERASDAWRHNAAADDGEEPRDVFDQLLRRGSEVFQDAFERQRDDPSQRRELPETIEDVFTSITSSFADGAKSWDTFVKSILNEKPAQDHIPEKNVMDQGEHKNQQVVTRDEHVDRFGYLHTTVTRKTFDDKGNQIGSQTHFTMRPAEKKAQLNEPEKEDDDHVIDRGRSHAPDHPERSEKKKGWFWK